MRTEVQGRGFSHVTNTFIDRWINLTYQDVNNRYPWPYLEATTSGTAPLTIADLGRILSVQDTTRALALQWRDIRTIQENDPALALSGTPRFFYRDGSVAASIKTYPTSANTISVRYTKIASDLATDVSIPILPTAFHYLLVEGACMRAYRRANEMDTAADAAQELENGIAKMHDYLIPVKYAEPIIGQPVAANAAIPQPQE